MNNIQSKVQNLDVWKKGITHMMFVDESGTSDITNMLRLISNKKNIGVDDKFFTVTGCIFTQQDYEIAKDRINELKNKYWENGEYKYGEVIKKVCFHSREIRRNEGPFSNNCINYKDFVIDLSKLIEEINYKIISVTINKEDYLLKRYRFDIYNTAMCFLIQRYIYCMPTLCNGAIVLESRGKLENKVLEREMSHIINDTGIRNITTVELKNKINGIYFNSKWNDSCENTFCGLEIADLTSYPIYKYAKRGKKDLAFNCLEKKIDKYPNYINKGLKIFP